MDLDKKVKLSKMLSLYGNMLTEYQKEIFTLYNDKDVSFSEIGEQFKISRQGVYDIITKVTEKLYDYESKLKFTEMTDELIKELKNIKMINGNIEITNKLQCLINKLED